MNNIITYVKNSLKQINYRLFCALLLMGFIPTVYTTLRIFFLGRMPDGYSLSIAAQLQWVNLIYEVIQEAFILPLYFFIGKAFSDSRELVRISTIGYTSSTDRADEFSNRVRTGLLIIFSVYTFLSVILCFIAEPLISFMKQDAAVIPETVAYIRLETVAAIFSTLVKFISVVLVTIGKKRYLYLTLGIQMALTVLFDIFLISTLSVSANLGVNGIAITNIIVGVLMCAFGIFILYKEDVIVFSRVKLSFSWVKQLVKVGGLSGLESFVRNFAFMMMIVRMVNMVGEQGMFWVANNFIWGWLLLPVIQLGELVKRDCGKGGSDTIRRKTRGYFILTTAFVVLWFISIPLWKPFMSSVLQIADFEKVFTICMISVGFYVFFAYNNVIDSIFYGFGKTNYMLFQSLAINTVFYGLMFVLYILGIYVPTLYGIALMFAGGTALDSVLTFVMFRVYLKGKGFRVMPR